MPGDRIDHAPLGDDRANVLRGRDVESRIVDVDTVRGRLASQHVRDLLGWPLFDRDSLATVQRQVECIRRCGNIERDVVGLGEHGDRVGSDLIRRVTVGCNPVGTGNDRLDASFAILDDRGARERGAVSGVASIDSHRFSEGNEHVVEELFRILCGKRMELRRRVTKDQAIERAR